MARFKQGDAPRVYEIEQRLSTIQQGSMDISTYYTELVTLWEEHKNYVEIPVNNFIQQLQRQVRSFAYVTPVHRASITDAGYTDPQSSTGINPLFFYKLTL